MGHKLQIRGDLAKEPGKHASTHAVCSALAYFWHAVHLAVVIVLILLFFTEGIAEDRFNKALPAGHLVQTVAVPPPE